MPIWERNFTFTTPAEIWLCDAIAALEAAVTAYGIRICVDDDFQAFKRLHRDLDKRPLTPNFDPDVSPLVEGDGFWMKGLDRQGRVVATQAARLYDCRTFNVAVLHETLRAFYKDPVRNAERGEVCRSLAPAAWRIGGTVCYHGELWLARPYRGRGLTWPLSRLLMALVLVRWAPAYLFGMAQPGIVTKGVAARYGYRNMQPGGMIWTAPSRGTLDEWIIWNDRAQLVGAVTQV